MMFGSPPAGAFPLCWIKICAALAGETLSSEAAKAPATARAVITDDLPL